MKDAIDKKSYPELAEGSHLFFAETRHFFQLIFNFARILQFRLHFGAIRCIIYKNVRNGAIVFEVVVSTFCFEHVGGFALSAFPPAKGEENVIESFELL